MNYSKELNAAKAAVRAAAVVCQAVQANLVTAATLEKKDKSPVTVADFAAQAIVCAHLEQQLGDFDMVGEEDSADLQGDDSADLRNKVVSHVASGLDNTVTDDQVLAWIDRGNAQGDTPRYWTLDPIDGTKGFLRGQQYAIALALIENGEVVLGVLGCPNLDSQAGKGALFVAVKGEGATMYPLYDADAAGQSIQTAQISSPAEAVFCESVESGHSDQSWSSNIANILGITNEPYRIDSQCKYAAVARNDASIYLRLPTLVGYQEKIWDHAAGKIVVEEAGGRVTDIHGNDLDFTRGKLLENNQGVVATCGAIHDEVIAAIAQAKDA